MYFIATRMYQQENASQCKIARLDKQLIKLIIVIIDLALINRVVK